MVRHEFQVKSGCRKTNKSAINRLVKFEATWSLFDSKKCVVGKKSVRTPKKQCSGSVDAEPQIIHMTYFSAA
jgi:hypothetical protein